MAGESAREYARRQREKAARSTRTAERWERGAEGEEATAAALRVLPSDSWTVLHDVRWPGRKLANIDHVAVGPGGVFVIDSKNWSGRIEVRDGVLRQNGYSREPAVASVAEAGIAVSLLAPCLESQLAVPVLCFAREEPIAGWARDVMVCSTDNVAELLMTRPPVLDAEQRRRICLGLDMGLSAASGPRTTTGLGPEGWPSHQLPHRPALPVRAGAGVHSKSQRRASRRGPGGRLLRLVAGAALLLYIAGSGILPAVGERVGELIAEQVATEQAEPKPDRKEDSGKGPGRKQDRATDRR